MTKKKFKEIVKDIKKEKPEFTNIKCLLTLNKEDLQRGKNLKTYLPELYDEFEDN